MSTQDGLVNKTSSMYLEYYGLLLYLGLAILISCIILLLSYALASHQSYSEKLTAYECGFSPFEDARMKFDVRFYLVGILFIIFDLEISFLFPWAVTLSNQTFFGFITMMIFLGILTIGFVYEWLKGALEWD